MNLLSQFAEDVIGFFFLSFVFLGCSCCCCAVVVYFVFMFFDEYTLKLFSKNFTSTS